MGLPVLVLGESGTGKSSSLRNLSADDVKVISVIRKPLPFKNSFEVVATDQYEQIKQEIKSNNKKITVVDDAQYLMANEFMRRAMERGYDKFTEIAQSFWSLIKFCMDLPDDHIVYFMAHIERDATGKEKIKTIGKMLDEKITVEGMFTIVLKTFVQDGQYGFLTQNSGNDTVKSPMGMFPSTVIENDLKYVDDKIRNFYEIGDFPKEVSDEQAVAAAPTAPEAPKKRRRRGEPVPPTAEEQSAVANDVPEAEDGQEEVLFEEDKETADAAPAPVTYTRRRRK